MNDWLKRRKISDTVISEFGIYWGSHQMFGDCIVIPIFDENGEFSFNKYRRNPINDIKPKYLYDKGSKTTLYALHAAKKYQTILITEGEMDCLVAWSANIPAVSSTGGAISFQAEWAEIFKDKEVILCFDNDDAGGNGMAKTLEFIPHAKILFLPDRPGVKDISDYAAAGGDLRELIKSARHFKNMEEVIEDRAERASKWQSTHFHDEYIAKHSKPAPSPRKERDPFTGSKIEQAKLYPITDLMRFEHFKAVCPWHNEKTSSLHYYPDNNRVYCFGCGKSGDAIDVYRVLNNCGFKEAVEKLQ